jgi:hypothetical protein
MAPNCNSCNEIPSFSHFSSMNRFTYFSRTQEANERLGLRSASPNFPSTKSSVPRYAHMSGPFPHSLTSYLCLSTASPSSLGSNPSPASKNSKGLEDISRASSPFFIPENPFDKGSVRGRSIGYHDYLGKEWYKESMILESGSNPK